ncbi:GINS complex subunit, partial [Cryomyces antarcticus]
MARVRAQIEAVEEQTARGAEGAREAFRLVVVQTELERVKFLVRGFLRARIAK